MHLLIGTLLFNQPLSDISKLTRTLTGSGDSDSHFGPRSINPGLAIFRSRLAECPQDDRLLQFGARAREVGFCPNVSRASLSLVGPLIKAALDHLAVSATKAAASASELLVQ